MVFKVLNKFLPYFFIAIISFLLTNQNQLSAKVKIEKFEGVLDWDKQSNYIEAVRLARMAEDINQEKKKRKKLKNAGLSKEEINMIIRKDRMEKLNADKKEENKIDVNVKENKDLNNNEIKNENNDINEENEEINTNIKPQKFYNEKTKSNNNKTILDFEKDEENEEKSIEIDLTIEPPHKQIFAYNDNEDEECDNQSYDDFELSRMLKKAGNNINNPEYFKIYAKEVSKIANRKPERQIKTPKIKENQEYKYDDYVYEDEQEEIEDDGKYYSNKKTKNIYAVNDNAGKKTKSKSINSSSNNIKKQKVKPIKNQSTSRFYAKNEKVNVLYSDEDGEEIFSSSGEDVYQSNGLSEKQVIAKNIGAPHPIKRENRNKNTQYQPQNIAQIAYDKNNQHLKPAVFESHVISQVFENLGDKNAIPLARALINKVGKTDIEDEEGNTLLMHAVARSNQSLIATLLSEGANPNKLNKEGFSPLHLATSNGDNSAVYSLMIGGGNPNLRDSNGNTSLMYASKMCDLNSIRLMMSLGGDPTIENRSTGKNSLDFAKENENPNAISLLNNQYEKLRQKKNPVILTNEISS